MYMRRGRLGFYSQSAPLVYPYGNLALSINTTTPLNVSRWDAGIIPTDASGNPVTSATQATSFLSSIPPAGWAAIAIGALLLGGRRRRR